jgi:alpha-glucosidase (family GH31 glycosyl hydrolase)
MYPEITHLIRAAIKRRYEIIPYLYSLALQSHMTAIPPQRWVGWGFESDPTVWTLLDGENQYWLGDTLMVGGVYEPGVSKAKLYLPTAVKDRDSSQMDIIEGYINLNAPYQHLPAGEWATIDSPWEGSIPILAKVGGAIPVGKPVPTACPSAIESRDEFPSLVPDDYRGVEIFPPKGSSKGESWTNTWFEDDGMSCEENARISEFSITYQSTETEVVIDFAVGKENEYVPVWRDLNVILPVGDERKVACAGGKFEVSALGPDARKRNVYKVTVV